MTLEIDLFRSVIVSPLPRLPLKKNNGGKAYITEYSILVSFECAI